MHALRSKLDGKEFVFGLAFFTVAWLFVLISVCPVGWYQSKFSEDCEGESYEGQSVDTKFTVTLWRYHSCSPIPLQCATQCTNKKWSELWKIGCGGTGPAGEEVYCFDFDIAGQMTSAFLILGICLSSLVFPLCALRLRKLNIKFITDVRIGKVILVLVSFCWACCIMSFMWYPYIADAKAWNEQNDGTIHLSVGWYLLMITLPFFFISVFFFILDFTKVSNRSSYKNADEIDSDE